MHYTKKNGVDETYLYLFKPGMEKVLWLDDAKRKSSDTNGYCLIATIPAHATNNRHEKDQNKEPADGVLIS